MRALSVRVGSKALKVLREEGLREDRISLVPGASGGPKWLILTRLDEVILSTMFQDPAHPVHLLGSSSGSLRMSYWANQNPVQALKDFEDVYLHQKVYKDDTVKSITARSREMIGVIGGRDAALGILSNPTKRAHLFSVRGKGIASNEKGILPAMLLAFAGNAMSRKSLNLLFERYLFSDPRDEAPFLYALGADLPLQSHHLTEDSYLDALMASCTLPSILEPVHKIGSAPPGPYWDGGITDYQWDIPSFDPGGEGKLIFYPHFFDTITPGWFDKHVGRRAKLSPYLDAMILISPSKEFVDSLPFGKIPDRDDFTKLSNEERFQYWETVLSKTHILADEFMDIYQKNKWAEIARPIVD